MSQVLKYFSEFMVKKCIRFLNELKADLTKPFIIFLIPEAAFIIKCFRMYYIRIFSFSTGLAQSALTIMRFSVRSKLLPTCIKVSTSKGVV